MEIFASVTGQKLKVATNQKILAPGTQNFIKFTFSFSEDWNELKVFAQFRQNDTAYNKYLDENNSVFLPHEIGGGICTLMLYGTKDNVIATTNCLTFTVDKDNYIADANSTEISTSLYAQLLAEVKKAASSAGTRQTQEIILSDADFSYSTTDTGSVSTSGELVVSKDGYGKIPLGVEIKSLSFFYKATGEDVGKWYDSREIYNETYYCKIDFYKTFASSSNSQVTVLASCFCSAADESDIASIPLGILFYNLASKLKVTYYID